MKSKYCITNDESVVNVCYSNDCDFFESFIDIYTEGDGILSPFKTIDDAKLFAKAMVRLLEVIGNG